MPGSAWFRCAGVALCLAVATSAGPAHADAFTPAQREEIVAVVRDALRRDPTILRDAIDALQAGQAAQRVAAIRDLLAANRTALYDHADPATSGPSEAITVVEFFDPRCGYCRQVNPALEAMADGEHGIRIIYKDIPILGPPSQLGSRALLAAEIQGGYRKLRAAMMGDSPDITDGTIADQARRAGLDVPRLQRDMQAPEIQRRLDENITLARTLGIEGTPAFVIGDRLVVGSDLTDVQGAIFQARPR